MLVSLLPNNNFQIKFNNHKSLFKRRPVAFKSTSAGAPLKALENITDPYFGEKMITVNKVLKAEKVLEIQKTVKQSIRTLSSFRNNLQVVEKNIFKAFSFASVSLPNVQFNDLLKLWYENALIRLKLEEYKVLDEIDNLSMNLEPKTIFEVRKKVTRCRQVIEKDDPLNKFKRKTVIDSIDEIKPKNEGEANALELLKKRVNYLPTSNTSINAFIVKYAGRTHQEIAKRLIRASMNSVEHVLPDSLGGENSLDNFILASAAANSLRGNMPLYEFIEMFPQIPANCQKYMNDIINVIHNGGLKGHQTYPYAVTPTLREQSKGLINLDLSKYKYTLEEAEKLEAKKNKWPKK